MSPAIQRSLCISATSTAPLRPEIKWRKCCRWEPPGPGGTPWRRWRGRGRWALEPSGSTSSPWSPGSNRRTRRTAWQSAGGRRPWTTCVGVTPPSSQVRPEQLCSFTMKTSQVGGASTALQCRCQVSPCPHSLHSLLWLLSLLVLDSIRIFWINDWDVSCVCIAALSSPPFAGSRKVIKLLTFYIHPIIRAPSRKVVELN